MCTVIYVTVVYYRSAKGLQRAPAGYLALGIHVLIHVVVAVVLVMGILMMDRAINIFDLFLIPQPLRKV